MSLTSFLQSYFNFNLLLAFSFLLLKGGDLIWRRWGQSPSAGQWLNWNYHVLSLVLVFSLFQPLFPKADFFEPPVKLWAATSYLPKGSDPVPKAVIGFSAQAQVSSQSMANFWLVLGALLFLGAGLWLMRDWIRLFRLQKKAFPIRSLRQIQISVHEEIFVPFSFWWFGSKRVLLPFSLLAKPQDFRIAILHELQHHRQGDTLWIYLMWMIRWLCFWNPFVYLWNRWICEIQEWACDETLVDHKKVSPQAYARCLVEVAETAILQKGPPVCAAGMIFQPDTHSLKRRIEMICETHNKPKARRSVAVVLALGLSTLLVATSYASSGWIQDRRISMSQAQAMLDKARSESEGSFPIVLNELVLAELNRYLGTIEGREFIRLSLERMEDYRPMIESQIQKYGVPAELLAVPITESGYRNLPQKPNSKNKSAGLWQFIPPTARIYGLQVDAQVDERLNPKLLTDAAIRYLQRNVLRFKDWQLAILAYNMGEQNVQKAIDKVGSRDAWALIRAGYEGDARYLAKINAAMIILKNQ